VAGALQAVAGLLFTVTLAGQVMVGNVTSFTVTVKEQVLELLEGSVARYVTVVTPTGKLLLPGRPPISVILGAVQLSVADMEP
jgi:hypothetical protein